MPSSTTSAPSLKKRYTGHVDREEIEHAIILLNNHAQTNDSLSVYFISALLFLLNRRPRPLNPDAERKVIATALDFPATGMPSVHYAYAKPPDGESPLFLCDPEADSLRVILYMTNDLEFRDVPLARPVRKHLRCTTCFLPTWSNDDQVSRTSSISKVSPGTRIPGYTALSDHSIFGSPPWTTYATDYGSECSTCRSVRSIRSRSPSLFSSRSRSNSLSPVAGTNSPPSSFQSMDVDKVTSCILEDWPVSSKVH